MRRPASTLGRGLTLTVAVAALCSVYAVANATLLKRLPYTNADRLVSVYAQPPNTSTRATATPLQPLTFLRLRDHVTNFEQIEGVWIADQAVMVGAQPESLPVGRISRGFFAMLGAVPARGRVFSEGETDDTQRPVVLAHRFWLQRFGGTDDAIGSTLQINNEPYTVVGVAPPEFEPGLNSADLWIPLELQDSIGLAATVVQTSAKLKPGATLASAVDELTRLLPAVHAEAPTMLAGWGINAMDLHEFRFGTQRPVVLMLAVAALVLALIALVNLANLTLSDVLSRRGEFALKIALGGRPAEVLTSELIAGVLLAIVGTGAGLLAAGWGTRWLLAADPWSRVVSQLSIVDWRVVLLALLSAVAMVGLSIVLPTLQIIRRHQSSGVIRVARRDSSNEGGNTLRFVLVAAQALLAVVLVSLGMLVVNSFRHFASVDAGFDPNHVITAQVQLPVTRYAQHADRARFVRAVLERVRQAPGVSAAGVTMNPFRDNLFFTSTVEIADRPSASGAPDTVQFRRVSPGYFETLRIPLIRGRAFEDRDDETRQAVVVVSKSFADRYWPGEDPVGKRLKRGVATAPWSIVAGVVGDVRDISLSREPAPTVYVPYFQNSSVFAPFALAVKSPDAAQGIAAIKDAVWSLDPTQPLSNVVTLDTFLANSMGSLRFRAALLVLCATAGLLLAGIGIFAIAARSVSERTHEAGVRLALGGRLAAVRWALVGTPATALAVGSIAGAVMSIVTASLFRSFSPDLHGSALMTAAAAAVFITAIGALSTYVASRRIAGLDPLTALRA